VSGILLRFNFMLVILSTLAVFTPVFSGYTLGMFMLMVLLLSRFESISPEQIEIRGRFWKLSWPISKAALILWGAMILAGIWAAMGTEQLDHKALRQGLGNAGVKYVLLWFVYLSFWWRAAAFRKLWSAFALSYSVTSVIHLVYCIAQRQFGIDWARGFDGALKSGRFAYGVYRISGFMGHPLTLGYCQALALVACLSMWRSAIDRWEKNAWLVASISAALVLLFSGSRGPIASAIVGVGFIFPFRTFFVHWRLLLASIVALLGLSWFFGLFSRFFELFHAESGGVGRSIHWAVYWRIFSEHLFHGIGPGAPREAISAYYLSYGIGDSIKLAHNSFLQFAADYGLLGFVGVVNWVLSWFVVCHRAAIVVHGFRAILAVSISGAISQNTFQDSEFVYALTVWTMLLTAREVSGREFSTSRAKNEDFVTGTGGATS